MIYFLLPNVYPHTYEHIDCITTNNKIEPFICHSLSHYLYDIKHKIQKYEKDWDLYKKYTNPYEFINSIIPFKSKSVSKYKPLSRSYFKMLEMIQLFSLHASDAPIKTFHLAEGPGGFIEALLNIRNRIDDQYIGMTILEDDNDENIPAWKKSERFLRDNPNVSIETGADGTGNIISLANFEYCNEKYASSMDIITADGGFDFSHDFNKQEINITKLLFSQICYAVIMQKKDGCFILKIFDCFMNHTIDLMYILSSFYEKVYITKPQTSRHANSEKYLVCKKFVFHDNKQFYPFLYDSFQKMIETDISICRLLSMNIPYFYISKLEEINAIIGQQQIESIHNTILLIESKNKNEKIDSLIKINTQKCIHWCIKHGIQYNNFIANSNVFLKNSISCPALVS